MSLIKNLVSGTIIAVVLATTQPTLAENQEPVRMESVLQGGRLFARYYGEGFHNGFSYERADYIKVCLFEDQEDVTKASYNIITGEWTEKSQSYRSKKLILNGILEHKKYVTEEFMKCVKESKSSTRFLSQSSNSLP